MNQHRGETPLEVEGRPYRLRLTTNVLANLEDYLGLAGPDLLEGLRKGGVRAIRALLRAALATPRIADRPETAAIEDLTDQGAGELIDKVGLDTARMTYWLLLANGGIFEREALEKVGLIPKHGAAPKEDPAAVSPPAEPSAPEVPAEPSAGT